MGRSLMLVAVTALQWYLSNLHWSQVGSTVLTSLVSLPVRHTAYHALQETTSTLWRWGRCLVVPLLAVVVSKVYLRLVKNAHSFRLATGAAVEGPLHGVCYALHALATVYLLVHWAVRGKDFVRGLVRLQRVLEVLEMDPPWLHFLAQAAEGVDWQLLLPRIVLGLYGAAIALSLGALIEVRIRSWASPQQRRQQAVLLSLLLHVYFSAAGITALFQGPVAGCLLFSWLVISILYVQSYQHMLMACRASFTCTDEEVAQQEAAAVAITQPTGHCTGAGDVTPAVQEGWLTGARAKRALFVALLGLYFPVAGRYLFYLTGHRTDFGTLQVCQHRPAQYTLSQSPSCACCVVTAVGGVRGHAHLPLRLRGHGAVCQHIRRLCTIRAGHVRLRAVHPAEGADQGGGESLEDGAEAREGGTTGW